MGLPKGMCLHGYMMTQEENRHVTVRTIEDNKRIAHFQCDHELSGKEFIELAQFVDKLRSVKQN